MPDPEKSLKFTDDEKAKAAALREKITRVMTEVSFNDKKFSSLLF